MGVTTQHHQHYDYTDAARRSLAGDLDIIARKCAADARDHDAHAAHLLEKYQAERDTAAFKRAKADQAYRLVTELREQPPRQLTVDERAATLVRVAQKANEHALDDQTIAVFLAYNAPGIDGNQVQPLFEDLCEAVKLRDGLETGEIDWRTASDVTGIGGRDRAVDLANGRVDAALWPLLHPGETRCVDCVGRNAHPRAATGRDGLCDYHRERRALDARRNGSAA